MKYLHSFIHFMGPAIFGSAATIGFLLMLIVMVVMEAQTDSIVLILMFGSVGWAFGFFLAGTVLIFLRKLGLAIRSALFGGW